MPFITLWAGNEEPVHITHDTVDPSTDHETLVRMHKERFGDVPEFEPETEDPEMLAARLSSVKIRNKVDGSREVHLVLDTSQGVLAVLNTFVADNGLWAEVSDAPPSWIECDDPLLSQLLVRHYKDLGVEVHEAKPEDWDGMTHGLRDANAR